MRWDSNGGRRVVPPDSRARCNCRERRVQWQQLASCSSRHWLPCTDAHAHEEVERFLGNQREPDEGKRISIHTSLVPIQYLRVVPLERRDHPTPVALGEGGIHRARACGMHAAGAVLCEGRRLRARCSAGLIAGLRKLSKLALLARAFKGSGKGRESKFEDIRCFSLFGAAR
eukprot:scaffold23310_cov75-Phaeocystis_antarctica.AAC.5